MNDESPNFCENKDVRKNTKLKEVSTETLLKYAYKLNEIVKDAISDEKPETFGLIFDGWSMAGEHYILRRSRSIVHCPTFLLLASSLSAYLAGRNSS